jgi:two-component system response regulator PilR (NtrC family)
MPSLRERPEDILLLVEHFYKKFVKPPYSSDIITSDALRVLMSYYFPGNVRELENIVERCLVLGGKIITEDCLPKQVREFQSTSASGLAPEIPPEGMNLEAFLDGVERHYLLQALERGGGVKKKAAEILGLSFRSFRYRLAKFGMDME